MSKKLKSLLFEAYRRNDKVDAHEKGKPLTQRWLGLGTAAAYRSAVDAGLMQFHDGYIPPPRCMGWLCLTDKGVKEMAKHAAEFQRVLHALKEDSDYQRSYIANYQLAGGRTA